MQALTIMSSPACCRIRFFTPIFEILHFAPIEMNRYPLLPLLVTCLVIQLLFVVQASAQLCSGSLGDPVVNITFGAGANPGPPLASGLTTMSYITEDCPGDGYYSIRNHSTACFENSWFSVQRDHTGDRNGYFMLVNASFDPSDFYLVRIDGLCTNTMYEFASWILNILKNQDGIQPNLTFQIEKLDGTVLQTYKTGNIASGLSPEWRQYGFFFRTTADASSVIVRIRNNAPGGYGNDLCIDDITFRPCGPVVTAAIPGVPGDSISVCEGNTLPIDLAGDAGTGYASPSYQWQLNRNDGAGFQDIPSGTTKILRVLPTTAGRYTYRLAVAEAGNLGVPTCRVNSSELDIYVRSYPQITFSPQPTACESSTAIISADVKYYSPTGFTSTWTAPRNSSPGQTSIETDEVNQTSISRYSVSPALRTDSGFYILRVSNLYGCTTLDSIKLSILEKPRADFNIASPPCADRQIQFTGLATVGSPNTVTSYQWDFGNGTNSALQDPMSYFAISGTYNVLLIAAASNGCFSDSVRKSVLVHPSPLADFKMPEVCLADAYADFTNLSASNETTPGLLSYSWDFGDRASGSNSSTAANPRHSYGAVGLYNVSLTATSEYGCKADTIKVFTINGSVPKSTFSLRSGGLLCSRDSVIVINQSTVDFGSITRLEIFWDYDRDPTVKTVDEDPIPGTSYGHVYTTTPLNGSTYRVRYVVYSGISCVNESEQTIVVKKSPDVTFAAVPAVCEDAAPFQLVQATESSGIDGTSVFSGNGVNGSGMFTPSERTIGDNWITYSYTSTDGCTSSIGQLVRINPLPIIDAGPDRTILKGGQIQLNATATGNSLRFNWSPAASIIDPGVLQPTVRPVSDIMYTVDVLSSDNCKATDNVLVKVVEFIAVPNAFTPNGDGKNDYWQIPYLESLPQFDVRVYNRYGQQVYHSANGIVSWDGTVGGRPQASGTYVYVFDRKQFGGISRGTILLIR